MATAAKFVDGSEINLICWRDWYDGPVSGQANWEGRAVWFCLASDAGEEVRTSEMFALAPEQLAECLDWFEEKREGFTVRAPQIRYIRLHVAGTAEQERLIEAQKMSLREWSDPENCSHAIAQFSDDHVGRNWYDSERWCPLQDEPISI